MDVRELEETDVLSISLDQAHLYFEMVVLTFDGIKCRLSACNADGSPIELTVGALQFGANLTNTRDLSILGELEGISAVDGVLILEGDFGDITISANKISVEQLT